MKHDILENAMALLERTPAALDALLRDCRGVDGTNEGGDTGALSTVIAHLIHCENEDWMPRPGSFCVPMRQSLFRLSTARARALQGKQTLPNCWMNSREPGEGLEECAR